MASLLDLECRRLASKHSSPSRKPYHASNHCNTDGHQQQQQQQSSSSALNNKYITTYKNPLPTVNVVDVSYRDISPKALFTGVQHLPTQYVMELNYKGNSLGGESLPQFLDKVSIVFPNLQHLQLDCADENRNSNNNNKSSSEQELYLRLYILYRMPDLKSINGVPVTIYEQQLARPAFPSGVPFSSRDKDCMHLTEHPCARCTCSQENDRLPSEERARAPLILKAKDENVLLIGEKSTQGSISNEKSSLFTSPPSLHTSTSSTTCRTHRSLSSPFPLSFQEKCVTTTVTPSPSQKPMNDGSHKKSYPLKNCYSLQKSSSLNQHVSRLFLADATENDHGQDDGGTTCKMLSARNQPKPFVAVAEHQQKHPTTSSLLIHHPPHSKKVVTFHEGVRENNNIEIDAPTVEPYCDYFSSCVGTSLPSAASRMRRKREKWRKRQKFSRNQACVTESVLNFNCSNDESDDNDDQKSYTC